MKKSILGLGIIVVLSLISGTVFAQSTGDFRSHQSGDWGTTSTWDQYNGASWVASATLPDTLHATTVKAGDSVSVTLTPRTLVGNLTIEAGAKVAVIGNGDSTVGLNIAHGTMTVNGTFLQTGTPSAASPYSVLVTSTGSITVGNGGVIQQDQNGGQIPRSTWNDGSTLMVTGLSSATNMGGTPGVSYYNIVWNCPNQSANANMGMHPGTNSFDTTTTIRGDLTILSTGNASSARAYFCGPNAGTTGQRQISRINVLGKISVLNGSVLSSNGTSKGYTDIIVTVYGNITVRDSVYLTGASTWQFSQLSISRGSQGGTGTATWYMKSDSITYGRKTTCSNSTDASTATPTNKGRIVFCKPGTQYVTLEDSINWTGPCNIQFGDSVLATTVVAHNSGFIGSGCVQQIKHNAVVVFDTAGYIGGGTNSNAGESTFSIDDGGTLITASPNGLRATGMGSSGAVRVSGLRNYGTAANYVYSGPVDQRLGSGFPAHANRLTINNAAGVVIDSVAGFTIDSVLAVQAGFLDLNGATVTLGPVGLLTETPGNTVRGASGVITTTRTLTGPSVSTDIAGLGIGIGSGADLGSTVISRGHAEQSGSSILRYFDIVPTNNAGLGASLNFFYDNTELNGQNAPILQLHQSTDAGTTWSILANTVDTANRLVNSSGLSSLGRYTLADAAHPPGGKNFAYSIKDGWNMISLPMSVFDAHQTFLFPTATSRAFAYSGTYQPADVLTHGAGYWLKFTGAQAPGIYGVPAELDSIPVSSGWNMIGAIGAPVAVGDVQSDPPGLTTSQFFGYDGSYTIADSLRPGSGYWIRVSAAGKLVLATATHGQNRIHIVPSNELPPPPPTVAAERPVRGLPTEFALSGNYPNPFNPSTSFEIALPKNAEVRVAIYNILGERISTLYEGSRPAGYYTLTWNGTNDLRVAAPSGIYFARMTAGSFIATQKMLLMK